MDMATVDFPEVPRPHRQGGWHFVGEPVFNHVQRSSQRGLQLHWKIQGLRPRLPEKLSSLPEHKAEGAHSQQTQRARFRDGCDLKGQITIRRMNEEAESVIRGID